MTALDRVRHILAAALVMGTIVTLLVSPLPLQPLVTFAGVGIVAGVLLALPAEVAGWIAGATLLFGIEWTRSILVRRGAVFPWYSPVLIAATFAVVVYYIGSAIKPRTKPARP
jgi:hypothetical protein